MNSSAVPELAKVSSDRVVSSEMKFSFGKQVSNQDN